MGLLYSKTNNSRLVGYADVGHRYDIQKLVNKMTTYLPYSTIILDVILSKRLYKHPLTILRLSPFMKLTENVFR